MQSTKKPYYALVEGHILGAYRQPGDPVGRLTEFEAKYPVQYGQISDVEPAPAKKTTSKAAD